jgi:hypothetical protein
MQYIEHSLIGQPILYEKHLDARMQSLIACGRLVSLSDAPLAKAGLDGSLLDLDIITIFERAANGVATDAVLEESNDHIPVGI